MSALIAYFSRSGNSEKIAKALKERLTGSPRTVHVKKTGYGGGAGFLKGILHAFKGTATLSFGEADQIKGEDTVVLVAPIWAGMAAPPIKDYMRFIAPKLTGGEKIYVVLTLASDKTENSLEDLQKLCPVPFAQHVFIKGADIKSGNFIGALDKLSF